MFNQIVDPKTGKLHNVESKNGQRVINNYRIALNGGIGPKKVISPTKLNNSSGGGQKQKKTLLKRLDADLKKNNVGNKKSSPRPKNNTNKTNTVVKPKNNQKVSQKSKKLSAKKNSKQSSKLTNWRQHLSNTSKKTSLTGPALFKKASETYKK